MTEQLTTLAFYIAFLILGAVLTWILFSSAILRAYRMRTAALKERAEAVNENERLKLQLQHHAKQIEVLEHANALLHATVRCKHEPSRC